MSKSNLLEFNSVPDISPLTPLLAEERATQNPYEGAGCPKDILTFLPSDGTNFGLFSDPYATMVYIDPRTGNHNGKFWLNQRMEEHSFTDDEIALLNFLATHGIATRGQIERIIFKQDTNVYKVRDFIKKCRGRGIITAFSWISPLKDGKKKPLCYGLTRVGAEAAETLFLKQVPKEFIYQPIDFKTTRGPKMNSLFRELVSNELYAEMRKLDRVISWERFKKVRLSNGSFHSPGAVCELIKDEDQFVTFWIETLRLSDGWKETMIKRFEKTQDAFQRLEEKPARVIVIVDSDARVPYVAAHAKKHMPAVEVRYTTDERLLSGNTTDAFLKWDDEKKKLLVSKISFLDPSHIGMTATEYYASQEFEIEDDDLDFEE